MKTKVMTKDNNEPAIVRTVWSELPPSARVVPDLADFSVPRAALTELVVMGSALCARLPATCSPGEKYTGVRLREACEVGVKVLAHNRRMSRREESREKKRALLLQSTKSVVGMLDMQALSGVPEISTVAKAVKAETFGSDFIAEQLTSRALYLRLREVEAMLNDNADLRERFEGLVPKLMLADLFRGVAEQSSRWDDKNAKEVRRPLVGLPSIADFIRLRTTEFVVNVLATALSEDQEAVARSRHILEPLTELRAELAAKRTRRAAKKAEAAEATDVLGDDDDDVIDDDADEPDVDDDAVEVAEDEGDGEAPAIPTPG
jgi:hypothetical protein